MYTRTDGRGNVFQFTKGTHTLATYSETTDTTVTEDNFRTVATDKLEREEGGAFGRGQFENPERAEAFKYLSIHDDADALIAGEYRIVVENAAGKVVAVIDRGRTDEVNQGDPTTEKRGEYGVPFPYVAISGGKGEVLGGQGHRFALQVKADSGTATFSLANSTMQMEGHKGELVN